MGSSPLDTFAYGPATQQDWALQTYPPLIDERDGTVFEQAIYTGTWLSKVRLRSFTREYRINIEYRFNEAGAVQGMTGEVEHTYGDRWRAEAKLYRDSQGGIEAPSFHYSRRADLDSAEPDDAARYTPMLQSVPLYRNKQEIPCAGLLNEVEKKMNAAK